MSMDDMVYSFDKVFKGNVIHFQDELLKTSSELGRVCKLGEKLIIPVYMNKDHKD